MIVSFNRQFTQERQNEAIYYALADALRVAGFTGAASWLEMQAAGERFHARRIARYLTDAGTAVVYGVLEAVNVTVMGIGDALAASAVVETQNTTAIFALYEEAVAQGNRDAQEFLHWFIAEQREEEAVTRGWLRAIEIAGSDSAALLAIDCRMAEEAKDYGL